MNRIAIALVWMFTITNTREIKSSQQIAHGTAQHGAETALKEQIHDKIAYIAAIIDNQHLNLIENLKASDNEDLQTEAAVVKELKRHVLKVIKSILPDVKLLMKLKYDREKSVLEVSKHFAEDHVEPILRAIFGEEEESYPKFFNALKKRIVEFAQAHIRLLFEHEHDSD